MDDVTQQVRTFYDQVGWHLDEEGLYQNARYEDLRPVAKDYIHACHLRVKRPLNPSGKYLLDAGSGPIQYPEYLEYSRGYSRRVCLDLSLVALQEARTRIGEHGLFVVADVSHTPFKSGVFDGIVTLHTFHHLPNEGHVQAYAELYRIAASGSTAVVVNGWDHPPLTRILEAPLQARRGLRMLYRQMKRTLSGRSAAQGAEKATFVRKNTAGQLKQDLAGKMRIDILVWRSVSVRFLRAFIHPRWGGRTLLRALYALEERFPHFFGENGQYPMIVIYKD